MTSSTLATAAKKKLLERRATLSHLRSDNDASAVVLGSEKRDEERAENDEISSVLVRLSERESIELREVDAALKRLEAGTWGRCEQCRGVITTARLKAVPEARTCAKCAS